MTIKKVLDVILQKISIIILVTVIFGAVGGYYYFFIAESEYTASTQFFVLNNSQQSDSSDDYTQLKISDMLIADYNVLATSKSVKDEVAQRLNLPDLSGYNISVSSVNETHIVKITVIYKDPKLASAVANKLVEVFSERVKEIMNVENVNVVDVAIVPNQPSGPNRVRNTLFSAFAGLVLTLTVVVLREMLDNSIKTAEDVEDIFEISVLAQVPRLHTARKSSREKKDSETDNPDGLDQNPAKADKKRNDTAKG